MTNSQQAKAVLLRELHKDGVLVLPNAWDAGSAALIGQAGAKAIATTSGGVSWSAGRPDQQALSRDEMVAAVARIVDAVELPVTADIEAGYGPAPEDVAATITAVIGAGVVGVNLEDSKPDYSLFTAEEQAARIRAARQAAEQAGLPELVINLRTDVFLFGIGEPEGRQADVLARAAVYAEAGADSLFVPGLLDLAVIAELVQGQPLPVNVMAGPGAPTVAEFEAAGVRRVSVGTAVAQAAYTLAQRAAAELLGKGTYDELAGALDFGAVNSSFNR
ncbi:MULTISPECIES: isocitrate lyase/phosphoenolpyruvate mutase family protein [unclassified Kitasatospora]|uniref:isocitrate lyase/PEP mutase family protein n=1 Tax=unclassified Kitasatospora TaxID=2633591 RepID=UPI00070ECBAD|nr:MULTISPECIES: isocitrate lyase/phosphoenolpyruvate mutase family protein [unclassified Kitasatospora]KQV14833.1 3-methyl-2-oxobutanoate hydroxymethyltransferase [Kitasatospora sp. Root107]KRB68188.1 3-methyl-2-oxobutanoate hydroxymethyltransferase [Kitasatospora sp. Root187]